jgi:hypothetical protein
MINAYAILGGRTTGLSGKKAMFVNRKLVGMFAGVALYGLGATAAQAAPLELITNGGFETGTFAGWTVTDQPDGSGSWFIDNADGSTPLVGLPTVGPATGSFYAVTDQDGPGAHALEQVFTVPIGATSVTLAFDMFINDDSGGGPVVDPAGLDYTAYPNQYARVDIMTFGAQPLSTAATDIVATLVAPTVDGGANPNPYTSYAFDITGSVVAGTSYKLRFGEVDNQGQLNQGVDNVSIQAEAAVPEPTTLALIGLGLAGIGFARKKKQA